MAILNKLAWRCRRGTRELDLLLSKYLEYRYSQATKIEQAQFEDLLVLEDNQLQAYLLDNKPAPGDLRILIEKIKANNG